MKERIAECINILGEFCGKRDLPVLTREELKKRYGVAQADIMVLFGGSIMCGGDVLAEAIRNKIARKYIHLRASHNLDPYGWACFAR